MKTIRLFLLLSLVWAPASLIAQVQWYQNQDGNNPPPGGTFGSCARSFTPNSFVACYQWGSDNETYHWKISKSHINGTEQRSFYLSGTWANIEMKVSYGHVYVLLRSFPLDGTTAFTIYKLDTNLVVRKQKQISFPNNFFIYNINAFELDASGNVYIAGDGQYPSGPDFLPASFVAKTDRNLFTKWFRMDSSATSFTQVKVDRLGKVYVIEDYYANFPEVKIRKYGSNGNPLNTKTLVTETGRFNLIAKLDEPGNLMLYGGKTVGDTAQAMYLYKISRFTGNILYQRDYFQTTGLQLQDFTEDDDGRLFALVSQYESNGDQRSVIARINPQFGNLIWTREYPFSADSTLLTKLVVNGSSRLYAIGAKRDINFLSKAVALRFNKNGNPDAGFNGPDSTNVQRSHALVDGLIDRNDQLITIGNTNDFDPNTFNSTYFRAFAIRYGTGGNHHGCDDKSGEATNNTILAKGSEATLTTDTDIPALKILVYPNPAANEVFIRNADLAVYERVSLYSLRGELLNQQYLTNTNTRIDVRSYPTGNYLLVLHTKKAGIANKTISLVLQR
ncbi:MAG: T9SS type A sorting domain-containing protein [Bacteroidetes bacterium]|nr:T9SS type A sorting domain-containing protein [Bacteroidota bacterium]